MHPAPAPPAPGPDQDPGPCPAGPWAGLVDWETWLALDPDENEAPPEDGEGYLDPDGPELPWGEDLAAIVAETDRIAAERVPGVSSGPAGGFGAGSSSMFPTLRSRCNRS